MISTGENDYRAGIVTMGLTADEIKEQMVPRVVEITNATVKGLYEEGARKFLVVGIAADGCISRLLTLLPHEDEDLDSWGCQNSVNDYVQYHNEKLLEAVKTLRGELEDAQIAYGDYFGINIDILMNATSYGFTEAHNACCGFGGEYNYNGDVQCGQTGDCVLPKLQAIMFRSPSSPVDSIVSSLRSNCSTGAQDPLPRQRARTILFGKDPQKKEKRRRLCPSACSSLQHERELKEPLPVQTQITVARQSASSCGQSAQSQLELLEKLTSGREKDPEKTTIAEQLASKVVVDTDETTVPLGKKVPMEYDDLTVSQKRNIRRQKYLDQVSQRNDAPFFATIALFVILPPAVILGVAVATGYIDLLP